MDEDSNRSTFGLVLRQVTATFFQCAKIVKTCLLVGKRSPKNIFNIVFGKAKTLRIFAPSFAGGSANCK